ncbi:stage II sporulation protein P [Bacillus sp. B1-b2]|uniref:stage II sporulation protein P n=1 Tax=Bacillus sp. B1-b2 TaxID=2653201 RepID=UPI00126146CF|nr:stage II sporulation protein P [Bacillus sp. B1-b2]KAB7671283.1 stage II sporulation protein P [Bacillus sp. B1-b2]
MQTSKTRSIIHYLNSTILGIILIFVFIAIITTSIFSFKLTSDNISNLLKSVNSTELYAELFHSENHLFPKSEGKGISLSNLFFHLTTNIRFDDTRTLLGRELPALTFFHTDIVVAEEGTTIADLPFESAPTQEMLENPLEVDEEKVEQQEEQPTKEENKPITVPENKSVLIYNSHNLEAFLPLLKNTNNSNSPTSSDERANVVGLSNRLTELLQQEGIGVQLDKTNINQKLLDRNWKFNSSYTVSKEVVETALNSNSELKYLIDIHRDAARKEQTTANINGENYAKLYFIVGQANENYEKNQEFATKLHEEIQKKYPGISRGVFLKGKEQGNGVYNQNYSDRAILLEVGGVDNTQSELNLSLEAFADVYSKVYWEENQATQQ